MAQDKATLEAGITKAKGDLTTARAAATDLRSKANKLWETGNTKTQEGRDAIKAAEAKAESAESDIGKAERTVKALEDALTDLGKEGRRAPVYALRDDLVKAIKAVCAQERHAATIKNEPELTGFGVPVGFRTPSGEVNATGPEVSPKPLGPLFARVGGGGHGGKRGGNGRGTPVVVLMGDKEYAQRDFVDSPEYREAFADLPSGQEHPADQVARGALGTRAAAERGARKLGLTWYPMSKGQEGKANA